MEQGRKRYTVKHPGRLAAALGAAVALVLLILAWALFLGRVKGQTADLSAYTTLTRRGETVTAVLDLESLLTELKLPNPRIEPRAERNGAVKALMNMKLELSFTEEPDVVAVAVDVNERALRRRGILLSGRAWTGQVKVLPRTAAQEESSGAGQEAEKPRTVMQDGYLRSLLDEEGKGLNLRKVCERVHFERDRLAKEIFGNSYVTEKTKLWFIVYPEGSAHKNAYRAAYTLTETEAPEGRSIGRCAFSVEVLDLEYQAGLGVTFSKTDVALYDTLSQAEDMDGYLSRGCTVTELAGGSVMGPERPGFDYNGFVRFVGLPMSHPQPDGSLWSPSSDPLDEDDLWRLIGNGEYTMTELLAFVRMEIYARRGYAFPQPEQATYLEHYSACGWYSPTEEAPERSMTATERRNIELLRDLEALLDS